MQLRLSVHLGQLHRRGLLQHDLRRDLRRLQSVGNGRDLLEPAGRHGSRGRLRRLQLRRERRLRDQLRRLCVHRVQVDVLLREQRVRRQEAAGHGLHEHVRMRVRFLQ